MAITFFWHDYETSGTDPRRDRPMQFAGLRSNIDLDEIGDPLLIYCRPAMDCLPHPEACLLTGITPQCAAQQGLIESEFIAAIHTAMSRPGTCSVGYNSLRFDDEMTRHTLYRNFYDPYGREWQNGNSRWDIIDLLRMCYALRPDGIEWPFGENGRPTFRLEAITAANGIVHDEAHDALSDVRATLALARLVRKRQPRLYDWLFRLRDKHRARSLLDISQYVPVVHSSGMFSSAHACTSVILPLAENPRNTNAVLVYDLRVDPAPFLDLDAGSLHMRLFSASDTLGDGEKRLPVKGVRVNMCPALAPLSTLDPSAALRIGIDLEQCVRYRAVLLDHPEFIQRIIDIHREGPPEQLDDVDVALYHGFLSHQDKSLSDNVRRMSPEQLRAAVLTFKDGRMSELLFRYRARNWPETLTETEQHQWLAHCQRRLSSEQGYLSLNQYDAIIEQLAMDCHDEERKTGLLNSLRAWGASIRDQLPGSG